jgi:hypothetical protein
VALQVNAAHANETTSPSSAIQGPPDPVAAICRWGAQHRVGSLNDEPNSARYFSAYGHDVDVPNGRLDFDPDTRRLTYTDESRSPR